MKRVKSELEKINTQLEVMREYADYLESLKDNIELLQEKTDDGTLLFKDKKEVFPCIVREINYTRFAGYTKDRKFKSSVTITSSTAARKVDFNKLKPYNHSTKILFGESE